MAFGNLELNSCFVTQSVDELNSPDLNFLICKWGRTAVAKNKGTHVSGWHWARHFQFVIHLVLLTPTSHVAGTIILSFYTWGGQICPRPQSQVEPSFMSRQGPTGRNRGWVESLRDIFKNIFLKNHSFWLEVLIQVY